MKKNSTITLSLLFISLFTFSKSQTLDIDKINKNLINITEIALDSFDNPEIKKNTTSAIIAIPKNTDLSNFTLGMDMETSIKKAANVIHPTTSKINFGIEPVKKFNNKLSISAAVSVFNTKISAFFSNVLKSIETDNNQFLSTELNNLENIAKNDPATKIKINQLKTSLNKITMIPNSTDPDVIIKNSPLKSINDLSSSVQNLFEICKSIITIDPDTDSFCAFINYLSFNKKIAHNTNLKAEITNLDDEKANKIMDATPEPIFTLSLNNEAADFAKGMLLVFIEGNEDDNKKDPIDIEYIQLPELMFFKDKVELKFNINVVNFKKLPFINEIIETFSEYFKKVEAADTKAKIKNDQELNASIEYLKGFLESAASFIF